MRTPPTLRLALLAGALSVSTAASAAQQTAIINVAACPFITWANKGYALLDQTYEVSNGIENDGVTTAVLLCDAELPSDATAFDYAEFEYIPGGTADAPWLAVFATGRWQGTLGAQLNWLQEIGWCGGTAPIWEILFPPPITICQTSGGLVWSSDQAMAADLSIVFLVVLPGEPRDWEGDPFGPAQAFRIVEYYEQ